MMPMENLGQLEGIQLEALVCRVQDLVSTTEVVLDKNVWSSCKDPLNYAINYSHAENSHPISPLHMEFPCMVVNLYSLKFRIAICCLDYGTLNSYRLVDMSRLEGTFQSKTRNVGFLSPAIARW